MERQVWLLENKRLGLSDEPLGLTHYDRLGSIAENLLQAACVCIVAFKAYLGILKTASKYLIQHTFNVMFYSNLYTT